MSPVAIVWPCPLAVDAYTAAGRDLGFPRPDCPSCTGPLVFWPGYRRYVREADRYWKIFVPGCGAHYIPATAPIATRPASAATFPAMISHPAGLPRLSVQPAPKWLPTTMAGSSRLT